jgi:hypothetical protein
MKIIETDLFLKLAKSKYPKSETTPYNPWAVCSRSVGREDKDAYERCIMHLKDQNKKKNKGKKKSKKEASLNDSKPAWEGSVLTPQNEDQYVEESYGEKPKTKRPPRRTGNKDMSHDEFLRLLYRDPVDQRDLVPANSKNTIITAQKNEDEEPTFCNSCQKLTPSEGKLEAQGLYSVCSICGTRKKD